MSKQNQRVEIEHTNDSTIELRYFDDPKKVRCYSWKMPINEAHDLAKWWENEGKQLRKRQLPVVSHKFGSILITMFTHVGVDIRGFHRYGGLRLLGYSLPGEVVKCLSIWLQDGKDAR